MRPTSLRARSTSIRCSARSFRVGEERFGPARGLPPGSLPRGRVPGDGSNCPPRRPARGHAPPAKLPTQREPAAEPEQGTCTAKGLMNRNARYSDSASLFVRRLETLRGHELENIARADAVPCRARRSPRISARVVLLCGRGRGGSSSSGRTNPGQQVARARANRLARAGRSSRALRRRRRTGLFPGLR